MDNHISDDIKRVMDRMYVRGVRDGHRSAKMYVRALEMLAFLGGGAMGLVLGLLL